MEENRNIKSHFSFKVVISVVIFIFLIVFSLMSGYYFGVWETTKKQSQFSYTNIIQTVPDYLADGEFDENLFWEVWDSAKNNYVNKPIDDEVLFYGALEGIAGSLDDPYSVFLNPEATREFNRELNGSFEGIGTEIGIKNNQLTIISPLDNSPASKAGLQAGDVVIKIDGEDTYEMSLDYAIGLIRGTKGTEVVLTVLSENDEIIKDISIVREVITVESVSWEILDNKIAYIKIIHFNSDTYQNFTNIASEILVNDIDGIILDLRNNPGGYLDSAVDVSGEFLEDKVVVIEDFGTNKIEYTSSGNAKLKDYKSAVLVNGGSASASEIVAGALQDYKYATIIGEQTFGKGSVQEFEQFDDGSSLKLTVAKWLTPNGKNIDEFGITPDIEVEFTKEDYNNDTDPQLENAIQLLSE
ncbi:MAG: S41 family peptidase [Candidatus Kerfeldbacteria bacterium]